MVTAAEDIAAERFPTKAERQAAADEADRRVALARRSASPRADVGAAGSPTWVAGVEEVPIARRGELLDGADAGGAGERRCASGCSRSGALGARPTTGRRCRRRRRGGGPPIWVVAEMGPRGPAPVTAELLAKAAAARRRARRRASRRS